MKNKKENKTIQTSRKKVGSRLLALVGCLLLVSVLALPCFADYSNGSFEPIVGTVDAYSADVLGVGSVDFDGFTQLRFTLFRYIEGVDMSAGLTDIAIFDDGEAYFYLPSLGGGSGTYYRCTKLVWENASGSGGLMVYIKNSSGEAFSNTVGSGSYLLVRDYPFDIVQGTAPAWEAMQFDAYAVGSVTPDVPDVPSVSGDADKVTTVWTGIMSWIVDALASVQSVFYVNGSLTFIGMLSVIGVSISIGFLIIGIVQRFLHLRG